MLTGASPDGAALPVEQTGLRAFESAFDPCHPEDSPPGSRMVGFGEISIVFELESDPGRVFKRVAGLRRGETLAYRQLVQAYVSRLESCGVTVAGVEATEVDGDADRPILYLVQEALDPDLLAHRQIVSASAAELERLLLAVLGHVDAVIGRPGTGFDAQLANWALAAPGAWDELVYLDLTTPLIRDGERDRLDLGFVLRALPLPLRALMRATGVERRMLDRYYDRRSVAMDVVSNLVKEGQEHRVPLAVRVVNRWLAQAGERPLTVAEIAADYRADARMWAFLQWVRRPVRWVRTRLLREPYDWVLAPAIDRKVTS